MRAPATDAIDQNATESILLSPKILRLLKK
jgi:hypothetical protein